MSKSLVITFTTADNKSYRVTIRSPKEGVTKEMVAPVAEKIVQTKIFNSGKRELKSLKKVAYVSRDERIVEA